MSRITTCPLLLLLALTACATQPRALRIEGTGSHSLKVTTSDPSAQTWFDQGLNLCYGFNHDEAVRSFEEVARIDPDCAMAYWGKAYALGPNINAPMSEASGKLAFAAIQEAKARRDKATQIERDMIAALAVRYADPPPADRRVLDEAYIVATRKLWQSYPNDDDIGFLHADALITIAPWDQWTPDFQPKPGTLELVATLERVLELNINHPCANHFYIHAMEASGNAAKAEAAADRLGKLTPGLGHMVHMPAHIYVQVGRYGDSIACNDKASKLDREYFERAGTQGTYHFYHAHNNHFRVWSAMYHGRYEDALESCALTLRDLPESFHGDPGAAEWLVMDLHVHLRFGQWQKVLAAPSPRQDQPYAVAMWHYARGVAFANTGRIEEARAEAKEFERVAAMVPKDQKVFIVPAHDVLPVARAMLAGETAYHAGDYELAFTHLRAAVVAEDAMRYSEPSPWMMPTRHALGALLLAQGKVEEAEACYRHDLKRHAGNGWSLKGLAECLERRGVNDEAAKVAAQFASAWREATVPIEASCFCRQAGK